MDKTTCNPTSSGGSLLLPPPLCHPPVIWAQGQERAFLSCLWSTGGTVGCCWWACPQLSSALLSRCFQVMLGDLGSCPLGHSSQSQRRGVT